MKINEPKIPEDEFRERWRKAYYDIERSFVAEMANFAADLHHEVISRQAYTQKALFSSRIWDTIMKGVRASRPQQGLMLLESMALMCRGFCHDYSVYDSVFEKKGGILRNLKGTYMPEHWLSELLLEHCGLFHSGNNIEICRLPGGSYYIYGDHPAIAGKNSPVHLGVCQVFDKPENLTQTLSIRSKDDLSSLTVELMLSLYPKGKVSMNTFFTDGAVTVNLVFRRNGSHTCITDQETDAEYITEERFENPERYITITRLYAQGEPLSNARRLPKHP